MLTETQLQKHWEDIYKTTPDEGLPWEKGNPTEELVKLIRTKKIKPCKVLDVCVGAGTHVVYLAKEGFEVYGIDIAPSAVKRTKEKLKKAKLKAHISVGNAYKLKFKKEFFDFVFDRGCLHHIPKEHQQSYVKGVYKVLKKGGPYMLEAFSDKNDWVEKTFTKSRIKEMFSPYFKMKSMKEIKHNAHGEIVYLWSCLMEKK